jgi:hypothetical protein
MRCVCGCIRSSCDRAPTTSPERRRPPIATGYRPTVTSDETDALPPDDFSFRQRFELAPGTQLPFEDPSLVIYEREGVSIELRSIEQKPISESRLMALWGSGFADEGTARAAGQHWRGALQRALAALDVGANFGLRNPNMGGFTDEALALIKAETGATVYRDSWDVLVFPSTPAPRFSSMSAEGQVSSPPTVALASLAASAEITAPLDEVAFDLFSASMRSAHLADVRLVLLVMAIECLVQPMQRSLEAQGHLDALIRTTLDNEALPKDEREPIANALRGLRWQSIRSGARRVAQELDVNRYLEEPTSLIVEAFTLRNGLVHGQSRPDLERVGYVAANLERMVGDLIAGPDVAVRVQQARDELVQEPDA